MELNGHLGISRVGIRGIRVWILLDWSYSNFLGIFYPLKDYFYHRWHRDMTFHLLPGLRMPPVKITTFSDRFHTRVSRSIAKDWPILTIEDRLFDFSITIFMLISVCFVSMLMAVMLYPPSLSSFVHACTNISKATTKNLKHRPFI